MKLEALHAHVERLLERITGIEHLEADEQGHWPPFPQKRCVLNVTVRDHDNPQVFLYAVAALDVPESPGLFKALNTVNSQIAFSRAYWMQGNVLVETEQVGDDLSQQELAGAMVAVVKAADFFGPKLVEQFGGTTPVAPTDAKDAAAKDAGIGLYL